MAEVWNYPQMYVTVLYWWYDNIGSGIWSNVDPDLCHIMASLGHKLKVQGLWTYGHGGRFTWKSDHNRDNL